MFSTKLFELFNIGQYTFPITFYGICFIPNNFDRYRTNSIAPKQFRVFTEHFLWIVLGETIKSVYWNTLKCLGTFMILFPNNSTKYFWNVSRNIFKQSWNLFKERNEIEKRNFLVLKLFLRSWNKMKHIFRKWSATYLY